MSIERELSVAVQLMFKHAKSVVSKNLTTAIRKGQITIDESKLPGLDLIIAKSIDEAFMQSSKEIASTLRAAFKSGKLTEHAEKSKVK